MKTRLVFVVTLVPVLLFIFYAANALEIETVLLEPNAETKLTVNLGVGFRLAGSFFIVNETEPGVVFSITEPNGTAVVSFAEMVGGFRTFDLTAQEPGNYTLHFSNRREPSSPQTVNLSYDVTGPYFYGIHVDIIIAAIAIAVLAASSIVLVVALERRRRRPKIGQESLTAC